jgi:DNA-binding NtrC family response regulator
MKIELFPANPVLIVDDEESVISSLTNVLKSNGITNIVGCPDGRELLGLLNKTGAELILLDLSMPHLSGNELLSDIRDLYPHLPVIIVTGTDEVQSAVECMKMGAFDYMVKPVESTRLASGVRRAMDLRKLKRQYLELKERLVDSTLSHPEAFSPIITQNKRMHAVFLFVEAIAKTNEPVLITGETGVGKNLIARAIHEISGREGERVEINVAGTDDNFFADDLFGHKDRAITDVREAREGFISRAKGGTLFMDEIGDLSLPSQVKLLKLLDTREYFPIGSDLPRRTDARFVVATNRDLDKLKASEAFRNDLYYRLSTYRIHIPPLRERKDDLPLLVSFFIGEASEELGKKPPAVPRELLPLLENYSFPGNIRELRSMIFDAVTRQASGTLSLAPFRKATGISAGKSPSLPSGRLVTFSDTLPTLKQMQELLVEEAMNRARGNQSLAAVLLGISHQALNKRLQRRPKE